MHSNYSQICKLKWNNNNTSFPNISQFTDLRVIWMHQSTSTLTNFWFRRPTESGKKYAHRERSVIYFVLHWTYPLLIQHQFNNINGNRSIIWFEKEVLFLWCSFRMAYVRQNMHLRGKLLFGKDSSHFFV